MISDLPQFVTGGAEKQAENLIEAWANEGHEVMCFGRRMGRGPVRIGQHEIEVRRIRTIQLLGRLMRATSYFLSLTVLLMRYRRRFDVVYTRFLGEAALTTSMLKRTGMIDAVLVSTPANTGGSGSDAKFLLTLPFSRTWLRLIDSQCDAINLIAPAMPDELRSAGFSGNNFSHIPNGVAIHGEAPGNSERRHRFLAIGRVAPQKGYDLLISALAMLKDRLYPGMVRIAGDGPERSALEEQAEALGVNHSIEWLGELDHASVLEELGHTKVFLLPSRYEGMSNAGLEAMERGCAMLMTRCGGLDTYIQADMGWTVEPSSVDALMQALSSALSATPEMLESMGMHNRSVALSQFSIGKIADRYLELFRSLTENRKRKFAS